MYIDGGGDENVATSSIEASNLIVLRVSSLFINYLWCHNLRTAVWITHLLFFNSNHLLSIQMQIWEFMGKVYWIWLVLEIA